MTSFTPRGDDCPKLTLDVVREVEKRFRTMRNIQQASDAELERIKERVSAVDGTQASLQEFFDYVRTPGEDSHTIHLEQAVVIPQKFQQSAVRLAKRQCFMLLCLVVIPFGIIYAQMRSFEQRLATRTSTLEGHVNSQDSILSLNSDRVNALEARSSAFAGAVNSQNSVLGLNSDRVTALEARVSALQGDVSSLGSQAGLSDRVTTLEAWRNRVSVAMNQGACALCHDPCGGNWPHHASPGGTAYLKVVNAYDSSCSGEYGSWEWKEDVELCCVDSSALT